MKLTQTELIALDALMLRQRAVQQQLQAVTREIEARLELPAGAIGTTHQLTPNGVEEVA